VPRFNKNFTEEVPVMHHGMEAFVDPINYEIKMASSSVNCNEGGTSTMQVGGEMLLRECHDPAMASG
jgi:hypothetical protein